MVEFPSSCLCAFSRITSGKGNRNANVWINSPKKVFTLGWCGFQSEKQRKLGDSSTFAEQVVTWRTELTWQLVTVFMESLRFPHDTWLVTTTVSLQTFKRFALHLDVNQVAISSFAIISNQPSYYGPVPFSSRATHCWYSLVMLRLQSCNTEDCLTCKHCSRQRRNPKSQPVWESSPLCTIASCP